MSAFCRKLEVSSRLSRSLTCEPRRSAEGADALFVLDPVRLAPFPFNPGVWCVDYLRQPKRSGTLIR